MTFFCIKYSGLKFNYIFETKTFVFIPLSKVEDTERELLDLEDFFSCKFDKNSEFYVLLKETSKADLTIEDFSEESLHKFKLLEAILNLIFSNYLKRDCIFTLEKEASDYIVKKIFKNLSNDKLEVNPTLLWKDTIFTKFLQEIIDRGFEKFDSIPLKEDFAKRYAFSVDMYLRGKFGENRLRYSSDLWISLEILSVITISRILHSHESFKVDNFFEEVKIIVKEYASKIPEENIDCWLPMKDRFSDHISNKINDFLPILQKCLKVAEHYLEIHNIKVELQEETDYKDSTKYQEYLDKIRDFKDYQDRMSIKKILNKFYKYRNALFHGGKLSEIWSLKSDRIKANFIKILEQLFFRVLDLDMIEFYQMGYPYQKIFGMPIKEGELKNLGALSKNSWGYMHKHYIEPLHTDYKNPFDYQIVREKYVETTHELDPLRILLNSSVDRILAFLNDTHPIQLLIDGSSLNHSLNYQDIKEKNIMLSFELKSGIMHFVYDKRQVAIENRDNTDISSVFIGMFDDNDVRHETAFISVPFKINPPYISFRFN